MKEELIILNGESDFKKYLNNWNAKTPILKEPQYVAIHVKGTGLIQAILEIDYKKSKLSQGLIVPKGEPIFVQIPIKKYVGNNLEGSRYSTFRKLITHETTEDL